MGEPVKIVDLAKDMIALSGLKYKEDIDIVFTGMRPGEKLSEELFYPEEEGTKKVHDKIFRSKRDHSNLHQIKTDVAQLESAVRNPVADVGELLRKLVASHTQSAPSQIRTAA
jgi:FlaA1/EpsC-like NDP-sugar epimerase